VAGRIWSIEKYNGVIGNRTRNLPACSTVPEPTTLLRAPLQKSYLNKTMFGMGTAVDGPSPQMLTNVILLSW
jgi:hypothetical protein